MRRTDIADLLSLIAMYDQRTTGRADIEAWHAIATEAGWTMPLARRAVIDYHTRGGDKRGIRPAHITDAIEHAREAVRRTVLHTDIAPPLELADDPRAEIAWRREYIRRATDRALDAWVHGEPMPELPPAEPPGESEVDPRIARIADRKAVPPIDRREPADANEHAERLAQARAELDTIRDTFRDRAQPFPETDHA